jgi:hypothetical protein
MRVVLTNRFYTSKMLCFRNPKHKEKKKTYFPTFDFIPTFCEVLHDIQHHGTRNSHGHLLNKVKDRDRALKLSSYVVPRHPSKLQDGQGIADVVWNVVKVQDPGVVVVLSRKHGAAEIKRVDISKGMISSIPSPKAKIKSTNAGAMIVDNHDLKTEF